ncbi:MAG: ATP-binding cassette domain-containing protein [Candidatus Lokiarchaeota archaeon]|nr:ATP-binding cassette domain-containing protein [Candidatus Lokiarchaeota archaeon]
MSKKNKDKLERNRSDHKITVDSIIKIYKRGKIEVVALRSLSCVFNPGEITVVMGPSGCGKTTLLNLIGGLDRPTSGKIIVHNKNICEYSDKQLEKFRRDKVGYVFQFMNLIPELNASENIGLPLLLADKPKSKRKKRIDELLDMVGLTERGEHKPDELSGGEQQRVAVAAALANNPDILLCDEPTGELDTSSKNNILTLLREIIKNYPEKIIVIVTHDLDLKEIADRLFYIKDGVMSHELSREDIEKEITAKGQQGPRKNDIPKKVMQELRELEYLIKKKIERLEDEFK